MKTIAISVRDKIAVNMSNVPYTCGNSDFVINFDFDAEWDEFSVKTARFIKDDRTYQDQVFQGNECHVPIIYNTNKVRVGVFAGNLCTSTPAIVKANKGILCVGGSPEAPTEDVYAQIMRKLNIMLPDGSGMNLIAFELLIEILRNGVYSTDQSANITALETELGTSGGGGDDSGETETPDDSGDGTHTHSYTATVTTAATCETAGVRTYTCSCGHSYTEQIPATGHNYVNGVCAVCGAADPEYDHEELPFVPGQIYTAADLEVVEGKYVSYAGAISEASGFSYAIIPCRGANRVAFNSSIYTNYGISMLDASKTYIRTVGTIQTGGLFTADGITTVEVSRDAEYIMFNMRAGSVATIEVALYQDPEYNGVYELGTWYRVPWRDGYGVNTTTGAITEKSGNMCSDYLSIYGAKTLRVTNGIRHFHVFYDADKNYLSTVTVQMSSPASYDGPDGAAYVVILPPSGLPHHNQSISITA